MGNSRVIFVGAVAIIMGLYTVGLQKTERAVGRIGEVHSLQMQAEEIAKSGVSLAIRSLGLSKPSPLPSLFNLSVFGGTVSYVADDAGLSLNEVRITATGTYKGHQATRITIVKLSGTTSGGKKKWSNWLTLRTLTVFNQAEFQNQYTTQLRTNELQ